MGEYYSLAQDCSLSLNVCIIPPSPSSSSDEGAANFAGYRDFCRLLKFSPISQQWHVLPKIFVFSFFASNPDDETDQGLTGGKVGKSTNLQHFKVAIPSLRCLYCLLWNIDNCNFIYDDRILKIGNRFSLHFSRVILIYLSKFRLAFQLKAFLQRWKEERLNLWFASVYQIYMKEAKLNNKEDTQ